MGHRIRNRDGIVQTDLWRSRGKRIGKRWRFRVWDPRVREYTTMCFDDERLGMKWAERQKAMIVLQQAGFGSARMASIVDDYIATRQRRGSLHRTTEATVRRVGDALIGLGAIDMRSASFGVAVERYLVDLPVSRTKSRSGKAASSTVRKHFDVIRSLVKFARDRDIITHNPLKAVQPPRVIDAPREVLTVQELRSLVKYRGEHEPRWILAVVLAYTGLRLHEALKATWADIDWSNRVLRTFGKGGKVRQIPVQEELFRILDRLGGASASVSRVGPIVPPRPAYTWSSFRSLLLRCGIVPERGVSETGMPRRIAPHSFRHTFAALNLATGVDGVALRAWLGHSAEGLTVFYAREAATFHHLVTVEGWKPGRFELLERAVEAAG